MQIVETYFQLYDTNVFISVTDVEGEIYEMYAGKKETLTNVYKLNVTNPNAIRLPDVIFSEDSTFFIGVVEKDNEMISNIVECEFDIDTFITRYSQMDDELLNLDSTIPGNDFETIEYVDILEPENYSPESWDASYTITLDEYEQLFADYYRQYDLLNTEYTGGTNLLTTPQASGSIKLPRTVNGITISSEGNTISNITLNGTSSGTTSISILGYAMEEYPIESDEVYTLSIQNYPDDIFDYITELAINAYDEEGNSITLGSFSLEEDRLVSFIPPSNASYWRRLHFKPKSGVVFSDFSFKVQLEKGTVISDWSPAPEDIAVQRYITDIGDDGITVHAENVSKNYLRITDESVDIVKNNKTVASYGDDIILKSTGGLANMKITSEAVQHLYEDTEIGREEAGLVEVIRPYGTERVAVAMISDSDFKKIIHSNSDISIISGGRKSISEGAAEPPKWLFSNAGIDISDTNESINLAATNVKVNGININAHESAKSAWFTALATASNGASITVTNRCTYNPVIGLFLLNLVVVLGKGDAGTWYKVGTVSEGYRPPYATALNASHNIATNNTNTHGVFAYVNTNGEVYIKRTTSATSSFTTVISGMYLL